MRHYVVKFFSVILFIASLYNLALAGIEVVPVIIDVPANSLPRKDVTVSNHGNSDAYVKMTAYQVKHTGTKQRKLSMIRDPESAGLLVTPSRLIIPPGESRRVRVMFLKSPGKTERIYRLHVLPVSPPLIVNQASSQSARAGIKVMVGYGVLIIQQPKHRLPALTVHRKGKQLVITNTGNVSVTPSGIAQCHSKHCTQIKASRMYAGSTATLPLKTSDPVSVSYPVNGSIKTIKTR